MIGRPPFPTHESSQNMLEIPFTVAIAKWKSEDGKQVSTPGFQKLKRFNANREKELNWICKKRKLLYIVDDIANSLKRIACVST